MRLLFIEDEVNLLNSLSYLLECEGFEVDTAQSGEDGLKVAKQSPPDLVLLDVNLPGIDGFETARRLRLQSRTKTCPIVMLTARAHPDDIVQGLSQFADDYVTKPFLPRVLLARIHALLRRTGPDRENPAKQEDVLQLGPLTVDTQAHTASLKGEALHLTKTEFDILVLLATHPDRVYTRAQVIAAVRGEDFAITERVVDFQVSGLRKKLGCSGCRIETVRGVGYKFQG